MFEKEMQKVSSAFKLGCKTGLVAVKSGRSFPNPFHELETFEHDAFEAGYNNDMVSWDLIRKSVIAKASSSNHDAVSASVRCGLECRKTAEKGWLNPFPKGSAEHTAWNIGYRNDLAAWLSIFGEPYECGSRLAEASL